MHELSIAVNIVDIATREAEKNQARKIQSLDLEVGALSGVITEALEFAMEIAVRDSMLEHANISIHRIDGRASCNECGKAFEIDHLSDICPQCDSLDIRLMQGQELRIRSLKIE